MATDRDQNPVDLIRRRAKEERRLLGAEQAAERKLLKAMTRLSVAESRLGKVQALVERRRERVTAARDELRRRQEARATGPEGAAPATSGGIPGPASERPVIPTRDDTAGEAIPVPAGIESSDGARPAGRTGKRRSDSAESPT